MYKKMKTLEVPVSPEVAAFAVVMETKLQMEGYDHVQSWEGIPLQQLAKQLAMKIHKLEAIDLEKADPHEVFTKAVVIGSLAMMLAELAAKKKEGAGVDLSSDQMGVVLPLGGKTRSQA